MNNNCIEISENCYKASSSTKNSNQSNKQKMLNWGCVWKKTNCLRRLFYLCLWVGKCDHYGIQVNMFVFTQVELYWSALNVEADVEMFWQWRYPLVTWTPWFNVLHSNQLPISCLSCVCKRLRYNDLKKQNDLHRILLLLFLCGQDQGHFIVLFRSLCSTSRKWLTWFCGICPTSRT